MSGHPDGPTALPRRQQAAVHDEWLQARLDTLVPRLMRRYEVDCWVIAGREYNEDPVLATMLPATWMNARRRTILCFSSFGAHRVALSRYAVGSAFPAGWDPSAQPDQWQALADHLAEVRPQRIAVNRSPTYALADGFSSTEFEAFRSALPLDLVERLVPADELALGWLETRSASEMTAYEALCTDAHFLLRTALSGQVVTPGRTTTQDLGWWLRQAVADAGFDTWFHPDVSVQRRTDAARGRGPAGGAEETIVAGDLIHIDFGMVHLGLHTDQQQHAYVLHDHEKEAPRGLQEAMGLGNRAQDILTAEMVPGRTGNDVLRAARARAAEAGVNATFYAHAIGLHGHAAGPTIGLWDQQEGVPGAGAYPLHVDTAYSIELSIVHEVPQWGGQAVAIMLEEDARLDRNGVRYFDDRQRQLWLI